MEIEERIDALEVSLKQKAAEKDARVQELEAELSAMKAKGEPGASEPESKDEDEFADQLLGKISVPGESKVGIGSNGYKTGGF